MDKKQFLMLLTFISFFGYGQEKDKLLNVSFSKNVNLFFPSPIVRAETGSSNFGFSYNKNSSENLGMLKGKPGPDSNLLVITEDGNVYSFILHFEKEIDTLNYFIEKSLSIRNLKGNPIQVSPEELKNDRVVVGAEAVNITDNDFYESDNVNDKTDFKKQPEVKEQDLYQRDPNEYYRNFCSKLVSKGSVISRVLTQNEKIKLELINLEYNKNEMYFTFTVENKSTLDFDMNYIRFFISTSNRRKRVSTQDIEKEYIYSYNAPGKIKAGSQKTFVYVFKQFSISKKKALIVELNEEKGERNLELALDNSIINNPY